MTNEEKAKEIGIYVENMGLSQSASCYEAAMEMAELKDKKFKELLLNFKNFFHTYSQSEKEQAVNDILSELEEFH